MKVSEMIYLARVKRRMSQETLGKLVNCSKTYISAVELEKKHLTNIQIIKKVSESLDLPLKSLLRASYKESIQRYADKLHKKWNMDV